MLRLSRLAPPCAFLLGFPEKAVVQLGHLPGARSAGGSCMPASIKIEFSYLNGNLMVPKIQPLTLTFDCNSRKGRRLFKK
jgi:hypothetical protein